MTTMDLSGLAGWVRQCLEDAGEWPSVVEHRVARLTRGVEVSMILREIGRHQEDLEAIRLDLERLRLQHGPSARGIETFLRSEEFRHVVDVQTLEDRHARLVRESTWLACVRAAPHHVEVTG